MECQPKKQKQKTKKTNKQTKKKAVILWAVILLLCDYENLCGLEGGWFSE